MIRSKGPPPILFLRQRFTVNARSAVTLRLIALALLLVSFAAADDFLCKQHLELMPKAVHPTPGRKHAHNRLVDIQHVKLDVTPDFQQRTVQVVARLTFKPIGKPLPTLTLNAVEPDVAKIATVGDGATSEQNTGEQLIIDFDAPVQVAKEVGVNVTHRVQPENSLYLRTPEMCNPNEGFTSEVICRVPEGMEVMLNGHLVSNEIEANALKAVHSLQDKPHSNYLIALAAGYFHKLEAKAGELPIAM